MPRQSKDGPRLNRGNKEAFLIPPGLNWDDGICRADPMLTQLSTSAKSARTPECNTRINSCSQIQQET